jgi:hypothetical protein
MNLVLLAQAQIMTIYGPSGQAILAAADALLRVRTQQGIPSQAYDPQAGLPALGVAPAALSPAALAAQLVAIEQAFRAQGAIIESLTIIGGPQVVPFGELPNPLPDGDGDLRSDAIYGLASPSAYVARWPVGRIPDAEPAEAGLLAQLVWAAAQLHAAGERPPRTLGYSSAHWRDLSADVLAAAPAPAELIESPPPQATSFIRERLALAQLIYCNLHGVRGGATWYGQAKGDSALAPALRPADLTGLSLAGALVVSQACFGARLAPQGSQRSLALGFLAGGARGFIGALALTYGAISLPIAESDLLVRCLFQELARPGISLGLAFQAAHERMLREVLRRQGFVDAGDMKTLLEFVLYGDPTLRAGLALA